MLSFNIFNMKIKIEYKIMAKEYGEMFLDSFLELAKEKEYTKISIVDLTERCSVSRQAFYYHYKSIDDMVIKNVNKEIDNICNNINESDSWHDCATKFIEAVEKYKFIIKSALCSKKSLDAIDLLNKSTEKFIRAFIKSRRKEDKFSDFLYTCCQYTFTGLIISEMKNDSPNLMNILNKIDERIIK